MGYLSPGYRLILPPSIFQMTGIHFFFESARGGSIFAKWLFTLWIFMFLRYVNYAKMIIVRVLRIAGILEH
jgi:hypothetical protein